MKILLDASYINNSGGKVLLETFLVTIADLKLENDFIVIFDERFLSDFAKNIPAMNVYIINSSIFNRYYTFKHIISKFHIQSVLCLNNLPPPIFFINNKIKVIIFFHNIFFFNFKYLDTLQKLLFFLKRNYIFIFNRSNYSWVVQSNSTKNLLMKFIKNKKIMIIPFYNDFTFSFVDEKKFDYIYVANNSPQKNIHVLLDVWEDLGREDFFPSLILTLGNKLVNDLLLQRIESLVKNGINVVNVGELPHYQIIEYYAFSRALIFPSYFESFGLPLIEGAKIGLPILASDRPFVHDVIETSYLFDPGSKNSILDCVKSTYKSINNLKPAVLKCDNELISLINILYV